MVNGTDGLILHDPQVKFNLINNYFCNIPDFCFRIDNISVLDNKIYKKYFNPPLKLYYANSIFLREIAEEDVVAQVIVS